MCARQRESVSGRGLLEHRVGGRVEDRWEDRWKMHVKVAWMWLECLGMRMSKNSHSGDSGGKQIGVTVTAVGPRKGLETFWCFASVLPPSHCW